MKICDINESRRKEDGFRGVYAAGGLKYENKYENNHSDQENYFRHRGLSVHSRVTAVP